MNLSHTNLSQFALPSVLVLLLVGMYSNTFLDRDLSTARPKQREVNVPPIVSSPGLSGVHARLWDDPLAVCQMHYEQQQEKKRKANSDKTTPEQKTTNVEKVQHDIIENIRKLVCHAKNDKEDLDTLFLPVMLRGGPWGEHHEHRIRIRYAVKAALAESGFATEYPDRMSYVVIKDHPTRIREEIWEHKDMIVPFRLYRFQKENSAINSFPKINNKPFQIAVLWVNEQQLGRSPIYGIENIIRKLTGIEVDCPNTTANICTHASIWMQLTHDFHIGMSQSRTDTKCGNNRDWVTSQLRYTLQSTFRMSFAGKHNKDTCKDTCKDNELINKIHIRIIGPSSSDMLYSITKEETLNKSEYTNCNRTQRKFAINKLDANVSIFNCRATGYSDCSHKPKKYSGVTMVHVAGKDCMLNKTIIKEIDKRYGLNRNDGKIAIISEHDTRYGREIVKSFRQQLADHYSKSINSKSNNGDKETSACAEDDRLEDILHFNYLRGIDGRGAFALKQESPTSGQDEFQFNPLDTNQYTTLLSNLATNGRAKRFPEGESQFDYLERLREQLVVHNRKHKIKAIGVLGTDVYDKLLILRALRPRFPEALFFTTDLDAAMLHPDERATTRNLLIASHYDLALSDKLQCNTPPFRDSYQTSTFLGTKLAVWNQKSVEGLLKSKNGTKTTIAESCSSRTESPGERVSNAPSLFQVNRWGAQRVGRMNESEKKLHREHRGATYASIFSSVVIFAIIISLFLYNTGSRIRILGAIKPTSGLYNYFLALSFIALSYLLLLLVVASLMHCTPYIFIGAISGVDHTVSILIGITITILSCYYLLFEVFRQYELNYKHMPLMCRDVYSPANMFHIFTSDANKGKWQGMWKKRVATAVVVSVLLVIFALLIKYAWNFKTFPYAYATLWTSRQPLFSHYLVSTFSLILFVCVPLTLVVFSVLLFMAEVRITRECIKTISSNFPVGKHSLAYRHLPFAFAVDQVRGIAMQSKILHKRTSWLVVFLVLFSLMFHPDLTPAREPMPLLLMIVAGSLFILCYDYKVRLEAHKARKMILEYIYGVRHKNGMLIASNIEPQSIIEDEAVEDDDASIENPCPTFKSDPLGCLVCKYNYLSASIKNIRVIRLSSLYFDSTKDFDEIKTVTLGENYTEGVHGSMAGIDDSHKAIEAAVRIIESEQRGAFQPWLETPLAQSIMWSAIVLICLDWLLRASAMWV